MKNALITGASSGIGAVCARALAKKGLRVCLVARRLERLEALVESINADYGDGRAICFAGDITDDDFRCRTWRELTQAWSGVDVLVNNAGIAVAGTIEDVKLESVRSQFEVNFIACLGWMQLAGRDMRSRGRGRIINMSSISGRMSFPGLGIYAASKFALEAASDAARREYQSFGVKVILIEPGAIVTDIWRKSQDINEHLTVEWEDSAFRDIYTMERDHTQNLMEGKGPSPAIVARAVCHAATAKRPKTRYCMPWDAKMVSILSHVPTVIQDKLIAKMFKPKAGEA